MAYERLSDKKVIATNLGTYISSQILLISKARTRRNLEDEAIFTRSVLEDNLTLDQQLKYRNDQLGRVVSGDKDEKRRIKNEISTVKDLIEQKKFSDAYLKQVMFLNSGMQSIDTTINWLNKKLEQTTDIKIKQDVKENISKLKGMRYQKRQNALSSQTDYANKDKTPKIVQDQIERINNERTSASLAGNEDYVTLLDLQLQSLNKTNEEAMVSRAILDFSVATMTGQSALGTLNELNTKVSGANELSPINIGGVQYDSAKQFWEMKRGDYLNDRTDNGFFARYQGELSDQVTYKQSRGILSTESLSEVKAFYETIKNRPELTDYQDRIAQEQQVALQSTADLRAQSILNEFAVKLDAKKAISDISAIQDTYGVDQTLNYQKIISSAAKEKESQVREILSTMQQDMANTPGLSQQQYLDRAVKSGAGVLFSPEELATAKATDVITGVGAKAEGQQFGETDKITIDPKAEGSSFAQQPQIEEGGLYRKPGEITVYKMEGGSLRPLTGDWNEDTLKQSTGKGYSAVQEITNFGQSPIGSEIKATSTPTIVKPEPIKPTQTSQGFASIVDYLKSTGQDASFESRKKLYKQQGLGEELDFSGTSEQNVSLLKSFEI